MSCISARGCRIGEGRPKVIVPIVEYTEASILEKAAEFSTLCADCVEWRVDLFEGAKDLGVIAHCAAKLRVALKDKLLLITFRTKAEGGNVSLTHEEYLRYIRTVLDTDCADLIDIEFFTAGTDLAGLIKDTHTAGAKVVCSSHDFRKTPPQAELVSRMVQMQHAGADLPKLAVMPQSRIDVLELLAATAEMADQHPETPVTSKLTLCGALASTVRAAAASRSAARTGSSSNSFPCTSSTTRNFSPSNSMYASCARLRDMTSKSSTTRSSVYRTRSARTVPGCVCVCARHSSFSVTPF